MLRSQINDATIVAGCCYVGGRFVGDRGKTLQVRFFRIGPMRVKTCNQHRLRRLWSELQDDISLRLSRFKRPMLLHVQADVFIETLDHHQGVMTPKLFAPEPLEIVTSSVVETGELPIVG